MKQMGLLFFTETYLTLLALLIFFLMFCVFIYRVFSKKTKAQIEYESNLPFDEGVKHGSK